MIAEQGRSGARTGIERAREGLLGPPDKIWGCYALVAARECPTFLYITSLTIRFVDQTWWVICKRLLRFTQIKLPGLSEQ